MNTYILYSSAKKAESFSRICKKNSFVQTLFELNSENGVFSLIENECSYILTVLLC